MEGREVSDEWLEQLRIEAATKMSDEQKLRILRLIGLSIWIPALVLFLYFYVKDYNRRKALRSTKKVEVDKKRMEAEQAARHRSKSLYWYEVPADDQVIIESEEICDDRVFEEKTEVKTFQKVTIKSLQSTAN